MATAKPDHPVVLFLAWLPRHVTVNALKCDKAGTRYMVMPIAKFCPVVAVLWPQEAAKRFLDWSETAKLPGRPNPASDDAIMGEWIRNQQETVFVACPSIVEHPDRVESVIGRRQEVWGEDKGRTVANFIGDRDIDWSGGT